MVAGSFITASVCTKGAEAALVHAGAWLEHDTECGQMLSPKAALLRFFGAGTVDQALMAGISVRHAGLRLFGLAGKTVILDEVHSYDAYTGSIVCHLAKLLAECGCTVLILSATLASSRRAALLGMPAGSPDAPYPLVTALRDAEKRRADMDSQAGRAMGTAWATQPDMEENASTRLMERPTWTVLVIRRLDRGRAVLADGREIVLPPESAKRMDCIGTVRALAESCVAVQAADAPGAEALERLRRWLGPNLRIVLLLADGRLAGMDGMPLPSGASYSADLGWMAPRRSGRAGKRRQSKRRLT